MTSQLFDQRSHIHNILNFVFPNETEEVTKILGNSEMVTSVFVFYWSDIIWNYPEVLPPPSPPFPASDIVPEMSSILSSLIGFDSQLPLSSCRPNSMPRAGQIKAR